MTEDLSKGQNDSELPPFDARLVASAAAKLDAAKIPFVLWVDGIDFVVEDDFMDAAYDTLHGAGFKKCTLEGCNYNKKLSYAPTPDTHLHITESERLGLYKTSDILWRFPNLSDVDGESIILASDPDQLPGPDILERGGRFQRDLHPVRVPCIYQLVQALLLLGKKDRYTYRSYWMNWVSYILDYCTENGVFDKSRLTGDYKAYIGAFLDGDYKLRKQVFERMGLAE